jgi:hypothetical protein
MVSEVSSPHELATLLTTKRFPVTKGFLLEQFLFLNDSQHASQAVYAVCCQRYMDGYLMFQAIQQFDTIDFTTSSYIECFEEISAILTNGSWANASILDTIEYSKLLLK